MRHRQAAKYLGLDGKAVETKAVRLPLYLAKELEAIAQELHKKRVKEGVKEQEKSL